MKRAICELFSAMIDNTVSVADLQLNCKVGIFKGIRKKKVILLMTRPLKGVGGGGLRAGPGH